MAEWVVARDDKELSRRVVLPVAVSDRDAHGKPIPGSERIPIAYLESLFGPGVRKALATLEREMARKRDGQPSALMDILIAFKQADMFRLGEPTAPGLVQLGRRGARSVAVPAR